MAFATFLPVLASAPAEDGVSSLSFILVGAWVLLLAIFTGVELISKVPPTLHTPLMSGSNAISGISIVGALYCASTGFPVLAQIVGFLAITLAMINVVGGYLVTDRMLSMFGSKKAAKKEKGS
jgi:NAD(P) transhydrogenase subunit alpha